MTVTSVSTPEAFLQSIRNYVVPPANVTLQGISALLRIEPHLIIRPNTQKICNTRLEIALSEMGYTGSELIANGFPFDAFITMISEYSFAENHFAPVILKTITTFDCELEFLRILTPSSLFIDAQRIRDKRNFDLIEGTRIANSRAYKDWLKILRNKPPTFLYRKDYGVLFSCFETDPQDAIGYKTAFTVTEDVCNPENLFETIRPYLVRPCNITHEGVSVLLNLDSKYRVISSRKKEIKPHTIRRILELLDFRGEDIFDNGYPFEALLLTLEFHESSGNKLCSTILRTLSSFDCELMMFRYLCPMRSETKFLSSRYWKEDRKMAIDFINITVPTRYQTSILQKYQAQLSTYPYHNGKGRALGIPDRDAPRPKPN